LAGLLGCYPTRVAAPGWAVGAQACRPTKEATCVGEDGRGCCPAEAPSDVAVSVRPALGGSRGARASDPPPSGVYMASTLLASASATIEDANEADPMAALLAAADVMRRRVLTGPQVGLSDL
jgi:hypothetical protein